MKRLAMFSLTLLPALAFADNAVVRGQVSGQFRIDALPSCGPESICLGHFVGLRIRVAQSISGPKVTRSVRAAWLQTSKPKISTLRQLRLFVLEPVQDADTRKRLGADYYVSEVARALKATCLRDDPSAYGISVDGPEILVQGEAGVFEHCFEEPEGAK